MKSAKTLFVLFAAIAIPTVTSTALAQFGASTQPVSATLDFSSPQAIAGKSLKALVHFTIPSPWHIYWKNPGDAGLPTRIIYSLPAEYLSGETEWPEYKTIKQPGDITAYGYEDEVTLSTTINIPSTAKSGDTVPVKAAVRWLACSTICIPGSANLEKSFTVAVQ